MEDKYLWLEDVLGENSIDWVKIQNEKATKAIKSHRLFNDIEKQALEIFSSVKKIPFITIEGEYVYNEWEDENHLQGLFRRTKIEDYLKPNPVWETILDLDKLSQVENEKWVFHGFELSPDESRALFFLSPGGSDADIVREFDMLKNEFVNDGFFLPEAKGSAYWLDKDTIRFVRSHGENAITDSGYARLVREFKRGEPLVNAKVIYEIEKTDINVLSKQIKTDKQTSHFLGRAIDFFNIEELIFQKGAWQKIDLPTMREDFKIVANQYIIMIKTDWRDFKNGDIIAYDLDSHTSKKIFSIKKNQSISEVKSSKTGIYLVIDEDVKSKFYKFTIEKNGNWKQLQIELPDNGNISNLETHYQHDKFFVSYSSFNRPSTYYYGEGDKIICIAKSAPSFFAHQDVIVDQNFAISLDATKVPYFLIYHKDVIFDGTNPTILYGYGGFEISMKPYFSNTIGSSWLERGGVFVVSNIRGGGEYGPDWHQSALKEKRHKAYEDFFAVAEDLISKKVTSAKHLGAMGGSNGGLLMGICYTQRPDLFAAINCGVPLLDMYRFHILLAGASWVAEYGNPDDEIDGAYIRSVSPYQNIKKAIKYPVIFLDTSTKDDRVHPGHARKFAAKLLEYGHPFYYYENLLGGHGGASNFKEFAFLHTLNMCFFWSHLK